MKNNTFKYIINYIGFSICWYCLVTYGDAAVIFVLIYLIIHLLIQYNKKLELLTIITISLIGLFADYILVQLSIIQFTDNTIFLPLWYSLLWPTFSSLLNNSLVTFSKFYALINAVLGCIGGVLAYTFGQKISTLLSVSPGQMYFIGLQWFILFPLTIRIAKYYRDKIL